MILSLIRKINPFKKEPALATHNWHLEYDNGYNSLFFNWRLESPCFGFWFCITRYSIDFSLSIWWTLHGCYIWNKEIKAQLTQFKEIIDD